MIEELSPGLDATDDPAFIAAWYDRFGASYLAHSAFREEFVQARLENLAALLPSNATFLDLGCGAGIPVMRWLADHYHAAPVNPKLAAAITGVDISEGQIALAEAFVPEANLIRGDMLEVSFPLAYFDAVVSLYALPHIPTGRCSELLTRAAEWTKPGGLFLVNWTVFELAPAAGGEQGGVEEEFIMLLRASGWRVENVWDENEGDDAWTWALAIRE